ncbi:tetratricopeptide repeat protein [Saccharicrinis sp. FJH54]|uniref:tetratricopeptide repeat protein n=1 Tax=Saccharicrinis sp. FJH54 TaxID=3344665 RepID=UPI0035D42A9D
MKQLIIALSLILIFVANVMGQSDQMQKANDLYAKGDYENAIPVYESLVDTGLVSGPLFFNLGNAYYKTGQLANAILNYERARLYMPKDKDLDYNLQMAQNMVVDKIDKVDVFFLKRWVIAAGNNLSSDQWAYAGIAAFILLILSIAVYTFAGKSGIKRLGFYFGILMIIASSIAFAYSGAQKNKITKRNGAVVFSPTVTVKGSPDDSGTELFILHEGTRVNVTDSIGDWNEIILGDGSVGWLKKSTIKKI